MADQYDKRASARRQALLALLSGTVAEPAAGFAGLYGLVTGGVNKGAHNVEATRDALTYHPRDASALEAVGRAVEPVTARLQKLRDYLGDKTMAHTGSPALATAGYMVPDTLLTLLGARGVGVKGPKLAQILERSEGPTMGAAQSQVGAIGAWHGSPHKFDQFSTDHAGTGSGGQSHGAGLYFSDTPEVVDRHAGVAGHKYQVELAPNESDLMDWDLPLTEQPKSVQKALKKLGLNVKEHGDLTGFWLHEKLNERFTQPQIAEQLRAAGVPGIRYADSHSPGAKPGTRNYVMFDANQVKIKGKE